MNREEAIKILKEHHDHWMRLLKEGICTEEEGENTIEALEMAIKALEQEAEKAIKMRDATSEEQKSIDDYIKSVSKPTGVDFWDLEQEPCDNAVSRQDVLDLAKKGILVSNGNYESVCKAINELPPVNPQPCEDAIDRAEAIKIASGYCHPANVAKELAKLPPVTPQSKTGHWIDDNENEIDAQYGRHLYKCSECNEYADMFIGGTEDWWDLEKPNYCPNCGCRMVEPQESEDKDADKKCTYKETGCGSCKRQLDCPIEADKAESEDRCKNCEYSHNPDYTRCHECKAESEA